MKPGHLVIAAFAWALAGCGGAQETDSVTAPSNTAEVDAVDAPENKQALATSPAELVERLSEASFYEPEEYRRRIDAARNAHSASIGLAALPQLLDPQTDPRRDISANEIEEYANVLTGISLQSREDGEIL